MDHRRLGEPPRYARVLQAFGAFLPAWEAAVAAALPPARRGWLASRSRSGLLARDLRALGLEPGPPAELAPLAGPAAAWGSLYVLEGSALGGQVISRSLAARGVLPHNGAAYFHGWGPATAAMWREFRAVLEAELGPPGALGPACAAACDTFDTLTCLLERSLDERTAAA